MLCDWGGWSTSYSADVIFRYLVGIHVDDLIKNHLLPLIEADPVSDFARQTTDEFRLAIKLTRSTPVCLSPEADKRQSMGELLTTWFPTNDRTIYIMVQRKEPDVAEQSGAPERDDEAEKAGKGGKGEGRGKGRGRGRPKKEIKPKAEPVEDVSFEDFSFGLDAEVDALEAE